MTLGHLFLQMYPNIKVKENGSCIWIYFDDVNHYTFGADWWNTEIEALETGHWVALENCSNAGVYCSECHTKIFDHYPIKKKLSYFCPHCGTRMEGEIERR